jgi:hypothetical protein
MGTLGMILNTVYWSLYSMVLGAETDLTEVSTAFKNLGTMLGSVAAAVIGLFVIIEGYLYITAGDDVQKAQHAKRAMGGLVFGAVLVILGGFIGTTIYNSIKP